MKTAISRSIIAAIAITTAVGIISAAQAASLTLSGITFTEATGDFTLTDGSKDANQFTLFQEVSDLDVALKIEGLAKYDPFNNTFRHPLPGIFLQLVVTNKTNTYWLSAKHELQRMINIPSSFENRLALGMPYPTICTHDIPITSCDWSLTKNFQSDRLTTMDNLSNTVTFYNPIPAKIAPGETVTFTYAIADWGEGGFYLKQSYTGYSEQAKSVPEPTSVISLLALATVGFVYLQKRKQQRF